MGRDLFTRTSYEAARVAHKVTKTSHVTREAEQKAHSTGKLNPAVDPAVDMIRRSLMRFEPKDDGTFEVTIGCPIPIESTCDTTGSMGDNVDIAMKNFPDLYELAAEFLPGYDPQFALGIFGDVCDRFVFQRPQFEMTPDAIVNYLKNMVPEHAGGDAPEDPHYGLFAAAYLTSTYANRIGLKGYHFLITDATAHSRFSYDTFVRIFGDKFLEKVHENGFENISKESISSLSIHEVVLDLLKRSHAYMIHIGSSWGSSNFWEQIYGAERVVMIPSTEYLPVVEAAIIGLTEGTLDVGDLKEYLKKHIQPVKVVNRLATELEKIDLRAQEALRYKIISNGHQIPKAGDIFRSKTDLWPISDGKTSESGSSDDSEASTKLEWL